MTPMAVSKRVVADRLDLIDSLLREIRSLPLGDQTLFFADRRNLWFGRILFAPEPGSFVRRGAPYSLPRATAQGSVNTKKSRFGCKKKRF